MIGDDLLNSVKAMAAYRGPRVKEPDIRRGLGRLARALKHADKIGEPGPRVVPMRRAA